MNKESLLTEVEGFAMLELEESESIIDEGKYHQGLAATVQGVWQKL
jgi:hypothetical protein